jgi:hypothetical protein
MESPFKQKKHVCPTCGALVSRDLIEEILTKSITESIKDPIANARTIINQWNALSGEQMRYQSVNTKLLRKLKGFSKYPAKEVAMALRRYFEVKENKCEMYSFLKPVTLEQLFTNIYSPTIGEFMNWEQYYTKFLSGHKGIQQKYIAIRAAIDEWLIGKHARAVGEAKVVTPLLEDKLRDYIKGFLAKQIKDDRLRDYELNYGEALVEAILLSWIK